MKQIKWETCECHGASGKHPPKSGKMLQFCDKVTPGMKVTARYKDLDVYLKIERETHDGVFTATVLFFEPVLSEKPGDLAKGDDVTIDREHICWLHDN